MNREDSSVFMIDWDFSLDKFQGLIQMKDAATAQSAKLVII